MGHQQYVIPYDTDEQLQAILDVIKLHNSYSSGYTDEFVCYNPGDEFKRLQVGEELTGASTAAFKAGKAYKCPRKGPCLARVVLVGNGGGRWCTFDFFRWHLMRAFPDVYVDGFHAMDAYPYDSAMGQRLLKTSYERIDQARISVAPEAERIADYMPVPAKYSTRLPAPVPAAWTALMEGATDSAERKKRRRENPRVAPYSQLYETTTDGWFVMDKHFATHEEAEAESVVVRDKVLADIKKHEEHEKECRRPSFEANKNKVLDEANPDDTCAYIFQKGGGPKCFMRRTSDSPFCIVCKRAMASLAAEDAETFQRRFQEREARRAQRAEEMKQRFLARRAEGKSLWRMVSGTYWLTDERVAEARTKGSLVEPGTVTYTEEGQEAGTPSKEASVAEIEAMLAAGKAIVLHSC